MFSHFYYSNDISTIVFKDFGNFPNVEYPTILYFLDVDRYAMLEHVLKLIEEDKLDEAIDFIEKNPVVKVKESGVFRGDVFSYNDPIVLEDRIIFSTCWKEGGKRYGAIYVLDKYDLSLIKKFEHEGYCKAVEFANGMIYAGFDKTLFEFDQNLNFLRKTLTSTSAI